MKILTNAEIIRLIMNCEHIGHEYCENMCPIMKECLYKLTGEENGSCLEVQDGTEGDA